jgi:t-SNARE complex subunit (syntaxin)
MEQQISELYKFIAQQEVSNHNIFITVLLAIVVILLGATWWWNKSGAVKTISREIEKKIEKEKKNLIKELNETLNASIDKKIEEYSDRIADLEGNTARLLALIAEDKNFFTYAIYWWTKSAQINLKLKNDKLFRVSVDIIIRNINKLIKEENDKKKDLKLGETFIPQKIYLLEEVKGMVTEFPNVLVVEKNEIINFLRNREKEE